jgi:dihydrofolate synthase/folylpolyglutamate synthase
MVMLQLQEQKFNNLHIVFGSLNDKDLNSILPLLPLKAIYYFCKPNTSRGLDAKDLQLEAQKFGLHGNAYNSVMDSLNAALYEADSEDLIFVGGSTFVVAEVV